MLKIKYININFIIPFFLLIFISSSCNEKLEEGEAVYFRIINETDKPIKIIRFGDEHNGDTSVLITGEEIFHS